MKCYLFTFFFFLLGQTAHAHGRPFEVTQIKNSTAWIVARTTRGFLILDRTISPEQMEWEFRCGEGVVFDVATENPPLALASHSLFFGTYDGLVSAPLSGGNTAPICTSKLVYKDKVVTEVAELNGNIYFMTATFGGAYELYRMDATPTLMFTFAESQFPSGLQVEADGFWTAWAEITETTRKGHLLFQPWDVNILPRDTTFALIDNVEQDVTLVSARPFPFVIAERNALETSSERLLDHKGQIRFANKNILDAAVFSGTEGQEILITTTEGVFTVRDATEKTSETVYTTVACDAMVQDRCAPLFGNSTGVFDEQHQPLFLFSELTSDQLGARTCDVGSTVQQACETRINENLTDLGLSPESKGGCGCRLGPSQSNDPWLFLFFGFLLRKKLSVRERSGL